MKSSWREISKLCQAPIEIEIIIIAAIEESKNNEKICLLFEFHGIQKKSSNQIGYAFDSSNTLTI